MNTELPRYDIGDRVSTPDGVGIIKEIEDLKPFNGFRYGVFHDIFPSHKPDIYEGNILFYQSREIEIL